MALPTAAIQTAALARYRGDATLQGLLAGAAAPTWNIFDQGGVPTSRAFPYLVVFPITSQSGSVLAFGTDAVDTYLQVSAFTQAGGFLQARAIAARIYALTHGPAGAAPFVLAGFANVLVLFENEQELPEPDGITQQVAHRYKIVVQG